jgi:hypothetical protein
LWGVTYCKYNRIRKDVCFATGLIEKNVRHRKIWTGELLHMTATNDIDIFSDGGLIQVILEVEFERKLLWRGRL